MGIDSILKVVQGWVRIKGDSDGTKIGNVLDALKVVISPGIPVNSEPIIHLQSEQTKNVENIAGSISLQQLKDYAGIDCQMIQARDSLWRLAWVEDVGGSEVIHNIGYGYTGAGNPTDVIIPSVKKFTTTSNGDQELRIYMTPLDNVNTAYINLSANKIS